MRRLLLAVPLLPLFVPASAAVHDDDPKILDRQPPYSGPAYRPAGRLAELLATAQPLGGSYAGSGGDTIGEGSISFPRQGVELVSWLPPGELLPGSTLANDCWGYVTAGGREIAIIGVTNGVAFVDLLDPSDPQVVATIPGPGSLWRDVKVYEDYAYIVTEAAGGIQVVDLSQLDNGVATLVNTVTAGGILETHNVAIDEESGYLYRCGGNSRGIRVYDLNVDPVNPPYVAAWNSRYVHDAQVVTYTSGPWSGRQIAFLCGGLNNGTAQTGLTVLDVTNKGNFFVRDQVYYSNPGYSHQAWLSPDRQTLYLDDELDEGGQKPTRTIVMDVSDLDDVQVVSSFTADSKAIGHNLYTRDEFIFEANYRSGLRIFDATDPYAPTEVAWFDTWPEDDRPNFNGLWSNYPYFPSGLVIGSDMEKGLFVWYVGAPELTFDFPQGPPETFGTQGTTVELTLTEDWSGALAAGTERLWFDAGEGLVELVPTTLGGGQYTVDVPPLACGAEVRWFVGARSTTGILWTAPPEAPYVGYRAWAADDVAGILSDDMESDTGWTVGSPGDDATTGLWLRGNPSQTAAQPGDDHTPNGKECWYTGVGKEDVDKTTSLVSPLLDLAAYDSPWLEAWTWFSNGAETFKTPGDVLEVAFSDDDGATWTTVESLLPRGREKGAWRRLALPLAPYVATTDAVRVRFRATDGGINNELEAAIDDVRVFQPLCGCDWENTCTTSPHSAGPGAVLAASGSASLAANDLVLQVGGGVPNQFGLFFYGPEPAAVPLGDGVLCVGGASWRLPVLTTDGAGAASQALDVTQPPNPAATITAGSRWYFQFWFRDPASGGAGFNFSDSLAVDFCP